MLPVDAESVSIVVSLIGLLMAPFWAKWWAAGSVEWPVSRATRTSLVIALSVATLLVTFAGPWLMMMAMHGDLVQKLSEPNFWLMSLSFFGPGVAYQTFLAYLASQPSFPPTPSGRIRRLVSAVARLGYSVDKHGLKRWLTQCLRAWMCAGISVIAVDTIFFAGLRENDTRAPVQLTLFAVFIVIAAVGSIRFVRREG